MTDADASRTTRRAPERLVALALLSDRDEILLIHQPPRTHYRLPMTSVAMDDDDDTLMQAATALQVALLAEDQPVTERAWLGRFAAPDDNGQLDMLEVYVARLGKARLQRDTDWRPAWAPLIARPPEDMIEPAIELQVMPALASLIDPQASTSRPDRIDGHG